MCFGTVVEFNILCKGQNAIDCFKLHFYESTLFANSSILISNALRIKVIYM